MSSSTRTTFSLNSSPFEPPYSTLSKRIWPASKRVTRKSLPLRFNQSSDLIICWNNTMNTISNTESVSCRIKLALTKRTQLNSHTTKNSKSMPPSLSQRRKSCPWLSYPQPNWRDLKSNSRSTFRSIVWTNYSIRLWASTASAPWSHWT